MGVITSQGGAFLRDSEFLMFVNYYPLHTLVALLDSQVTLEEFDQLLPSKASQANCQLSIPLNTCLIGSNTRFKCDWARWFE